MSNKKPIGIALIAIYSAFSGILFLLTGAVMLLASAVPDMPVWMTIIGMLIIVFGVFSLAAVYGLWSIQAWGVKITKWLYIIAIPLGIISIFPVYPDSEMTVANTVLQIFGISISAIIIWYISKESIRELYLSQNNA
ncbi:hypothetical protein CBF23_011290 [Marinomonas agarivorans]|nr:hypothetical protein CBF23_011290 [Marinomonas agarivorans]